MDADELGDDSAGVGVVVGADVVDVGGLFVVFAAGLGWGDPGAVEGVECVAHVVGEVMPVGDADLEELVVSRSVERRVDPLGADAVALRDRRCVASVEVCFVVGDVAAGVPRREVAEVCEERVVRFGAIDRRVEAEVPDRAACLAGGPIEASVVHVVAREVAGVISVVVDLVVGGEREAVERFGAAQVPWIVFPHVRQFAPTLGVRADVVAERGLREANLVGTQVACPGGSVGGADDLPCAAVRRCGRPLALDRGRAVWALQCFRGRNEFHRGVSGRLAVTRFHRTIR